MASEEAAKELKFDTADFGTKREEIHCAQCQARLTQNYFVANTVTLCGPCSESIRKTLAGKPDFVAYARGIALGIGAGFVGSLIYYLVLKITSYEIGLIAILVGYLVGKAVMIGSGNRGGLVFRIVAVVLTYVAIVSTYVPPLVNAIQMPQSVAQAITLAGLILAIPFLSGMENVIGIFIIAFALYEAARQTKRVQVTVEGPFEVSALPSPGAAQ